MISTVAGLQLPDTVWRYMTSDGCVASVSSGISLPLSPSLSFFLFFSTCLLHPCSRHKYAHGRGKGGGSIRVRWSLQNLVLLYKSSSGRGAAQTSSTQVRPADRDACYGAHFPGAALLSGVVSVCPQRRLQIYWGEFLMIKHLNFFIREKASQIKTSKFNFFVSFLLPAE